MSAVLFIILSFSGRIYVYNLPKFPYFSNKLKPLVELKASVIVSGNLLCEISIDINLLLGMKEWNIDSV